MPGAFVVGHPVSGNRYQDRHIIFGVFNDENTELMRRKTLCHALKFQKMQPIHWLILKKNYYRH